MSYEPVIVRIVSKRTRDAVMGVSGVFLSHNSKNYIVALGAVPVGFEHASFEAFFTSRSLIKNSAINWVRCKFDKVAVLPPLDLVGFDSVPRGEGALFVLIPQGHEMESLSPIRFVAMKTGPCMFEGSPFTLSNVSIFSEFRTRGDIVYVDPQGRYGFSDLKYLDNTIGGNVVCNGTDSVGLVYTCLKKKNGDGEISVVLPWQTLVPFLPFTISFEKHTETTPVQTNTVVSISTVSHSGTRQWGSGVVLNRNTVVTNSHVVTDAKRISVQFPNSEIVIDNPEIHTPFANFDMCFIESGEFPPSEAATDELLFDMHYRGPDSAVFHYSIPTEVTSVGHGLMRNSKPMVCQGVVNYNKKLELFEGWPAVYAFIIVSASSWSGSSGGGVFDTDGNLVGIMVSNGRLSNGEVLSKFNLVIPVHIVLLGLYSLQCPVDFNDQAKAECDKIWGLRELYTDVFVENLKL